MLSTLPLRTSDLIVLGRRSGVRGYVGRCFCVLGRGPARRRHQPQKRTEIHRQADRGKLLSRSRTYTRCGIEGGGDTRWDCGGGKMPDVIKPTSGQVGTLCTPRLTTPLSSAKASDGSRIIFLVFSATLARHTRQNCRVPSHCPFRNARIVRFSLQCAP